MPAYFPENNTALSSDTEVKSLQKINDLLQDGITIGEVEIVPGSDPLPVVGTVTANLNDPTNMLITTQISDALFGNDTLINALNSYLAIQNNVPISGTVTANAGDASNLVGGGYLSLYDLIQSETVQVNQQSAIIVDSINNPISGTVTANAGTGTFAVTTRGATGEATVSTFTSTSSAALKSANANRKLLTVFNEGAGNLHILYGSGTASTTNYSVRLSTGEYLEIDKYTGQVNAIFASAGTARVTEIT